MTPDEFTFDFSADLAHIQAHNARKGEKSEYRIRTDVAPKAYEGRIGAPLTWLLANPSYDATPGYTFNHPPPLVEGWPLQSLAPAYRDGYGKWTWDRLRELRERMGDRHVSNNVLVLQLCPWASEKFDASLKLPSRSLARNLALHQLKVGSQFVLVRSESPWRELVPELSGVTLARTAHQLTAYLSQGNLKEHWESVYRAVAHGCPPETPSSSLA
ncbi:MAG: hypothetical protein ACREXN_02450 [Polaromonas sp.]